MECLFCCPSVGTAAAMFLCVLECAKLLPFVQQRALRESMLVTAADASGTIVARGDPVQHY